MNATGSVTEKSYSSDRSIRKCQPFDDVERGGRVAEGIVRSEVRRVDQDRLAVPTSA
jgi:hypothetical protein